MAEAVKIPFVASCDVPACGWREVAVTEEQGRTMAVLHALVRHPDIYRQVTGRDPASTTVEYGQILEIYGDLV